jgi:hypothetical protein
VKYEPIVELIPAQAGISKVSEIIKTLRKRGFLVKEITTHGWVSDIPPGFWDDRREARWGFFLIYDCRFQIFDLKTL